MPWLSLGKRVLVEIKGDPASVEKALGMINKVLLSAKSHTLEVSRTDAMAIIGEKGKKIGEIRSITGATINIQDVGENKQIVEIYGDKDSVEKAVANINQIIMPESSETLHVSRIEARVIIGVKGRTMREIENGSG